MNIFIIKISLVVFGNRELTWPLGCREPSHPSQKNQKELGWRCRNGAGWIAENPIDRIFTIW
tara:strand:- start:18806 stop:18991 length:186 start_codon:yes stop_codon:yes gene_type:complete